MAAPPLPAGFQLDAAPAPAAAPAVPALPPGFQLDGALAAPAVAPQGMVPGSREYANWARDQAVAGNALPQVSVPSATPAYDAFKAGFDQNYQQANPQAQNVAANPQASTLPGPVGQLANTLRASGAGIDQGVTAGWGDEINAGLMTPVQMAVDHSLDVSAAFGKVLAGTRDYTAQSEALNPQAAHAGDIAGGLALAGSAPGAGAAASTAPVVAPTAAQLAMQGAKAGGVYGAVNGAGRGDTLEDRGIGAVSGGVTGALTGALAGKLAGDAIKPPALPVPSIADLEAVKNAAYQHADNLGVTYSPTGYDDLVNNLVTAAKADHINPDLHPGSAGVLQDMLNAPPGYSPTLTQLDQLRQVARRDAFSSQGDGHFGQQIIDGIDNFINKASNAQVATGSGPQAAQAITDARAANSAWRKTQTVQALIDNANLQAGAANSGGNINNALRQQFKTLLKQDSNGVSAAQKSGFSPDEIHQIANLTLGGTKENVLRFFGNILKPNAISAVPWGMAVTHMPALAALPAAGQIAKTMADTGTIGKANALAAMVARRNMPGAGPQMISPTLNRVLNVAPFVTGGQVGGAVGQWMPQLLSQQPPAPMLFQPGPQILPGGVDQ
jgi:hypothetical protein